MGEEQTIKKCYKLFLTEDPQIWSTNQTEFKKKFLRWTRTNHPDKGGSTRRFQDVSSCRDKFEEDFPYYVRQVARLKDEVRSKSKERRSTSRQKSAQKPKSMTRSKSKEIKVENYNYYYVVRMYDEFKLSLVQQLRVYGPMVTFLIEPRFQELIPNFAKLEGWGTTPSQIQLFLNQLGESAKEWYKKNM